MTPDREHRLRSRIDDLIDQREDAREKLKAVRDRFYKIRRSRDLWRTRALRKKP